MANVLLSEAEKTYILHGIQVRIVIIEISVSTLKF